MTACVKGDVRFAAAHLLGGDSSLKLPKVRDIICKSRIAGQRLAIGTNRLIDGSNLYDIKRLRTPVAG